MRPVITFLLVAASAGIFAQPFPIGTRNITFYDQDRDRDVGTVIHHPAISAGMDQALADGEFPVLVFGHGFLMNVGAYENLRDHFVPLGYILVLPTTEGGLADHGAFGEDLAYLAEAMQAAGQDPGSAFHDHVAPATALMGHSMGGGASMLGAAGNMQIQAVVNFAAAETNPSAIAAAAQIGVPTLMFAATEDCVTPPGQHQQPMYDALTVDCKAFVNIIGGGHCYFANAGFFCEFGESTCSPALSISRMQQQAIMDAMTTHWLDAHLKSDQNAFNAFLDSVSLSGLVLAETTCLSTGFMDPRDEPSFTLLPVPASQVLYVKGLSGDRRVIIHDTGGRALLHFDGHGSEIAIDISGLANGIYMLSVEGSQRRSNRTFVVMH